MLSEEAVKARLSENVLSKFLVMPYKPNSGAINSCIKQSDTWGIGIAFATESKWNPIKKALLLVYSDSGDDVSCMI